MEIRHCPNPQCTCFSVPPRPNWYMRYGHHSTRTFGRVQRYRCHHCRRTFSDQTFSIDYYVKKAIDYESLLQQLVTASGCLDMGRALGVRAESIQNRCERLARCVLCIHSDLLELLPLREDLVADGLESFAFSQYYPNHVSVAAGSASEFIYTQGFAVLRRKGRMTAEQKRKRQLLELRARAHPKAVQTSVRHLAEDLTQRLARKGITHKTIVTDEHRAYPRAFAAVPDFETRFTHVCVSSRQPRTRTNPLFPVNYVDRQVRKDMSDHVRETVQFAKCPSALMARMALYRFYHNCCMPRRVRQYRKGNPETHAERAGVPRLQLQTVIARHWGRRGFLHKVALGCEELKTWLCEWRNPGIAMGRYVPRYARV